jgi:Holliday junction resolvase RusA-like endonuclease
MITLVLPYPPTVNHMYRRARGHLALTPEALAFRHAVRMIAMVQGVTPLVGPVAVFLDVYRPRRRGDLDNILKATLDALNGIAYRDDEQVEQITAVRYDDKRAPRIEVSVVPLT